MSNDGYEIEKPNQSKIEGHELDHDGHADDADNNGSDDDLFYGGAGDDQLYSSLGKDELYGGNGNDRLDGGADNDSLNGEAGSDDLVGGTGDDRLFGGGDNDTCDGGDGIDTAVFSSSRSSYTIHQTSTGYDVSSTNEGVDALAHIERLEFSDGKLLFDTAQWQSAGEAYRLYQAAFARTPDTTGLKYWIETMESGLTYEHVAENFIASAEFQSKYGVAPSNSKLVDALYLNVLSRIADDSGKAYWLNLLDNGLIDTAHLLINFSESNENIALVGNSIQNGIWISN